MYTVADRYIEQSEGPNPPVVVLCGLTVQGLQFLPSCSRENKNQMPALMLVDVAIKLLTKTEEIKISNQYNKETGPIKPHSNV